MPTGAAGPALNGSLDLFNSFNAFNGTGSYFAGFQAGYNYMAPSRWLFGVEADVSFPNTIAGTSTFTSASTGTASYAEQVEFSGTLRGRIGYAPNLGTTHWLFYATGGFAYSFDQFTRTQIAGTAGRRHRGAGPGRRICSWCRASAASPAPASSSRCRRTGRRGSNICSPITATAASRSRPARSASTPTSTSANCASGSTTSSTAIRTRAIPPSRRRCRSSTISPSTARPLISINMSSRSAIPIPARTASRPTRAAKPGTSRRISACGCGRAPSFGSIRRSTRASV